MIGIIGAMEKEIDLLRDAMEEMKTDYCGSAMLYTGRLYGQEAALCLCGIGKVHAAASTEAMLMRFRPKCVLNIGVAGAIVPSLRIGDVVVADGGVQHDVDTSALGDPKGMVSGVNKVRFPCAEKLSSALSAACEAEGMVHLLSGIATGDQFIAQKTQKEWIAKEFSCAACDMEGAAISQVCYEWGTPYGAYRVISDELEENGLSYIINCQKAAEVSQRLLKRFLSDLKGW